VTRGRWVAVLAAFLLLTLVNVWVASPAIATTGGANTCTATALDCPEDAYCQCTPESCNSLCDCDTYSDAAICTCEGEWVADQRCPIACIKEPWE
jgi:hypothetical protein